MSRPRDERHKDLFRPSLDEIIALGHPLARLAREVEWGFLDGRFCSVCRAGPGQPPLPTRLVAGLLILKHMHDLSDEALRARWVENPYYPVLLRRGELLPRAALRSLLADALAPAARRGTAFGAAPGEPFCGAQDRALATKDLERVAVDTIATQSHAKQFKRHNRELRFLRTRLGRLIRDIRRKSDGDEELREAFAIHLSRADQVRRQRQRGWKLYSLHSPEVECIGKELRSNRA